MEWELYIKNGDRVALKEITSRLGTFKIRGLGVQHIEKEYIVIKPYIAQQHPYPTEDLNPVR